MKNTAAPIDLPRQQKIDQLTKRLIEIRHALEAAEEPLREKLKNIHPSYQKSARNLAHCITLRDRDIRPLQQELAELGLSSLGRAEAHVIATLDAVLAARSTALRRNRGAAPPGSSIFTKETSLREECLNEHVFLSFNDARSKIERWRTEYNGERPLSSLGHLTPEEFAAKNQMSSAIARTAWPADQELWPARCQRAPASDPKPHSFSTAFKS